MRIFPPLYSERDKGHGRIETRKIQTSTALDGYINFPYASQVFRIERFTTNLKGEILREEIAYGITSLPKEKADPKRLLGLVRNHWGIENSLHWVRDVTLGSSKSKMDENSSGKTVIIDTARPQKESPAPVMSGTQIEGGPPERYRTKLVLELENDRMAILERAFEKARKETGERERGALIEYIARAFIEDETPGKSDGSPYRITLHSIPESKVAWIESPAGPKYVPESTIKEALCDAEILDLGETPAIQKTTEDMAHRGHSAEGCGAESHSMHSFHETCTKHAPDSCEGECLDEGEAKDPAGRPVRDQVIDPERHGPRLRRTIPQTLRRQVIY